MKALTYNEAIIIADEVISEKEFKNNDEKMCFTNEIYYVLFRIFNADIYTKIKNYDVKRSSQSGVYNIN